MDQDRVGKNVIFYIRYILFILHTRRPLKLAQKGQGYLNVKVKVA